MLFPDVTASPRKVAEQMAWTSHMIHTITCRYIK